MNCRKTASIAVLLLLSVLWSLPATAQTPNPLFTGVWFGFDPNDGSPGFIGVNSQFDTVFIDINATGGCSAAGGGVYLGVLTSKDVEATTGAGVPDENVLKGPMNGVCQGNKDVLNIFFFTRYHPNTDEIEFRNAAFFRRVSDLDADIWVSGAKEMKTVSLSGWVFFNTVINQTPVLAVGADCIDPPNLVPGANLSGCDLRNTDFAGVDLSNAVLHGAEFQATELSGNFSNSDLSDADLRFANITTLADLSGANLQRADLTVATVSGNLSGANLMGANLTAAIVNRSADLSGANLAEADLTAATVDSTVNMTGADLTGATLLLAQVAADLTFAVIRDADLRNTDLSNANLTLADFEGTDLSSVIWANTICPDGSNSFDQGTILPGGILDVDGRTCLSNLVIGPFEFFHGSPLQQGEVGRPYLLTIGATGGVKPYSLSLISGSVPPGIDAQTLEDFSVLQGVPLAAGTFFFEVQYVDFIGTTIQMVYEWTIVP